MRGEEWRERAMGDERIAKKRDRYGELWFGERGAAESRGEGMIGEERLSSPLLSYHPLS